MSIVLSVAKMANTATITTAALITVPAVARIPVDMARELGELLGMEHELRLGLQQGEFPVYYQPAFDLETHAIVGVEALVRWNSASRGLVLPD